MTQLLSFVGTFRFGTGVRFVYDNKLRTMLQEHGFAVRRLDIVNRNDLEWNITEHILIGTHILLQTAYCTGTNDFCFQTKFVAYFILPLLTKIRQTDYSKALNLSA